MYATCGRTGADWRPIQDCHWAAGGAFRVISQALRLWFDEEQWAFDRLACCRDPRSNCRPNCGPNSFWILLVLVISGPVWWIRISWTLNLDAELVCTWLHVTLHIIARRHKSNIIKPWDIIRIHKNSYHNMVDSSHWSILGEFLDEERCHWGCGCGITHSRLPRDLPKEIRCSGRSRGHPLSRRDPQVPGNIKIIKSLHVVNESLPFKIPLVVSGIILFSDNFLSFCIFCLALHGCHFGDVIYFLCVMALLLPS